MLRSLKGSRFEEILGLRRKDIDLVHATIQIEESRTIGVDGKSITKTKTSAGRRKLALPAPPIAVISDHLRKFTGRSPVALVFNGRARKELTRGALQGFYERARMSIGRSDLRLHDLRHTGLTLAAVTGATTAELMHRAGQTSTPAALRETRKAL